MDIYICDLKNVLVDLNYANENIDKVINRGKEIMDSLNWIRKLSDHYSDLRTKVEDILKCMEGFEKIILNSDSDSTKDNFDSLDWMAISKFNTLSIEELEAFRTKILWEEISKRDYLNEEYIRTFKDELYWHILDKNPVLTDELRKKFSYKFG